MPGVPKHFPNPHCYWSRSVFVSKKQDYTLLNLEIWAPKGMYINFPYGGMGSMPIFGARNLTLNKHLGHVNDNIDRIRDLGPKNLKKGKYIL